MARERDDLLARWRGRVRALPSARALDTPTLNDHIPAFLDELAAALRSRSDGSVPDAECAVTAPEHGEQRAEVGFDIVEVVAEYGILRECIHEVAEAGGQPLQGRPLQIVNRLLDGAVAAAIKTFAAQKARELQRRREEYLAFVAHDLRTPLSAIALAAGVLEMKFGTDDPTSPVCRMVGTLRRNARTLGALVDKVIEENSNLLAGDTVRPERRAFDLWPLVEAVLQDVRPIAGASGPKLINAVPDALGAYGDASLVRRVLQNLIGNALKYTPAGEVVVTARAVAGGVECAVRDTGAGIPADRLARVFEPFETDPDKSGGAGLGLAIVKTFVEAHGGTVSVESAPGAGSTFTFLLPAKPA